MADYTVSGAGTPEVNQGYTARGTWDFKTTYESDDHNFWLWWSGDSHCWVISPIIDYPPSMWFYYDDGGTNPDDGTWSVGEKGSAPAPTVTAATNKFVTVNSHDGLTPSIVFTPTPAENGLESPQNCDFTLEYEANESVTLTAPASDPVGWEWVGWYSGGAPQSADKTWNFTLSDDTIVVATYQPMGNGGQPIQLRRRYYGQRSW